MTTEAAPANEVHLIGRVSGRPTQRTLPSGDELVQLRVVVPRPPRRGTDKRAQVDTIDVACWSARSRASALRLPDGQGVEISGALRRRFFAAGAARASRYEVGAASVRRVTLP
ncbi:single-stranded DNA-binding protein [Ornithinimicrobium sp. LYQ103]|uniref:single-stranded DNA-binding protein n=1 Tax=Ornithinimicrobium sp. LYQ103 TaxID=3378796 RepID=UPI00385479E8